MDFVLDCVLDLGFGFGELFCVGVVLWIFAWIVGCASCIAGFEGLFY